MKRTGKREKVYKVLLALIIAVAADLLVVPPPAAVAQSVPARAKIVYFTFDDGPSERYTPQVLGILKREHVKATFFVVGYRCDEFPGLVKRIRREGHEIGNHGYAHDYFAASVERSFKSDVLRADQSIMHACGWRPVYYRPPGGVFNHEEQLLLHNLGHRLALWTVDSHDWSATNKDVIVKNVEARIQPGSVVLFHDGVSSSRYTVAALPTLIHKYQHLGYQFRTLPLP